MRKVFSALLLCMFVFLPLGSATERQQEFDSKLLLEISALPVSSGDTMFQVTFLNGGDTDRLLNLGFMVANGQKQEPVALSLIIARGSEAPTEWHYSIRYGLAARLDDYLVPLRAGSTYSLRLSLTDFYSPNLKAFGPSALRSGTYRIKAEFNGKGPQAINRDTSGMRLMHIWTGRLQSKEIEVISPPV